MSIFYEKKPKFIRFCSVRYHR